MSDYSPREERWNVITHGLGALLSLVALVALVMRGANLSETKALLGLAIFGLALLVLYSASTLYHAATNPVRRARLKIFDHIAIYVLIAGTYTPFTLITLADRPIGLWVLGLVWAIAAAGTVLKLFFTGRFKLLSTVLYVGMGWIIVLVGPSMQELFPAKGLNWLLAGGIAYTVGAVFYSLRKIPFNHAIFHGWVLVGSFCHFMAVYFYIA